MLDVFKTIAAQEGVTPEEVYAEIQKAIDEAWEIPEGKWRMIRLTKSFFKPTPDTLISAAHSYLTNRELL